MRGIYKLSTIAALLSFCIASYGQNNGDKSAAILKIKGLYQQINNEKKYKTVTIDNGEDFLGHNPDNGGSLTGYYKNDTLKKMVEWVGLSYKVLQNEYYFDKGELFFVYATESKYHLNDSTQTFDYDKLEPLSTGRYYFSSGKLIKTIFTNKELNASAKQDAAGFLTESKAYAKLLKARRSK